MVEKKNLFHFFSYRTAIRFHLSKRLLERGWRQAERETDAIFTDENLTLNDEVSKQFEYKHLLANLIQKHCPDVMPPTYWINDENYSQTLAKVIYEHYFENGKYNSNNPHLRWILKPSMLNNGEGIKLFDTIDEVKMHYAHSNRLGGDHVLQKYISDPDLINSRKYTFRVPVIISNFSGAFLYRQGYINISAIPYDRSAGFSNRKMHITNYVLDEEFANIEQRSTQTLSDFNETFSKIAKIVRACLLALIKEYPQYLEKKSQKRFEIFGFDFTMDKDKRVWLLEINQGPDAPTFEENPMNAILWDGFWENIIDDFVLPCALDVIPKNNYAQFAEVLSRKEGYSKIRAWWGKLKN